MQNQEFLHSFVLLIQDAFVDLENRKIDLPTSQSLAFRYDYKIFGKVVNYDTYTFTDEEFEKIPPESYYGTTLIAAVIGKNFTFGVQIGDGSFVAIFEDGKAVMPFEYEESAPANITSSICNTSAASMFNSFYTEGKKPIAFFASTDGLYTSFGSEYDFLDYHSIITTQLALNNAYEEAVIKNLIKRSHFGTEDDISLSCVYDPELAKESVELLKQRVEENKEKAQSRKKKLLKRI